MIIKDVQLEHHKTSTSLTARCKIRKIGWDTVYIRIDSVHQNYIYNDASPFAAMLLLPAMKQAEDLIIKGSISDQFYKGMQDIMAEVSKWDAGLKPISIKADKLLKDTNNPTKTASFFSGGVDSFYTYLKHKKDRSQSDRIDSFILVKGFDIKLSDHWLWSSTFNNIKAVAKDQSVELVVVETNIQELLEPILAWDYTHGGCLAAIGLFLRSAFSKIYIPSTFSTEDQIPWGSNLVTDKYWSTEKIKFVHDGAEATRINKILWQVSKSPVALKHLRVCYINKQGAYNCGSCAKCLRTMISLYAAGVLNRSATFPKHIDINLVANLPAASNQGQHIFTGELENLAALKARHLNPKLQVAIEENINQTKRQLVGKFKPRIVKLSRTAVYIDHVYAKGRLYRVYGGLVSNKH